MKAMVRSGVSLCIVATAGLILTGCVASQEATVAPRAFYQLPAGHVEHMAYYPTGKVQDSVLMLRKVAPVTVSANEEFEYTIEVYNPMDKALLKNVMIRDFVSPGLHIISSTPTWQYIDAKREEGEWIPNMAKAAPDIDDVPVLPPRIETQQRKPDAPRMSQLPEIRWYIEELYPEKMVTIKVRARATTGADVRACVTAEYQMAACVVSRVVAPELSLNTMLDKELIICTTDQTDIRFQVSNSGTAAVRNVVVRANLPEGITTVEGRKEISVNVGEVNAKQTKEATQRLRVSRPGNYTIRAKATGSNNLVADSAAVNIQARQGSIQVAVRGPAEEYVGLPADYEIIVRNAGDARVRDVAVESRIPPNIEFIDATGGGRVESDRVIWRYEQLPAGETQRVTFRYRAKEPGTVRVVGTARGICAGEVSEIVTTKFEGVPALLVEVVDRDDPDRVGQEEVYEIQVTNQGSAPENNIVVQCQIEDQQSFVSATGASATAAQAGAKSVTFNPLPTLAPKETAVWRVLVKCIAPGDVRFHAQVNSDQHARPIIETESTSIYAAPTAAGTPTPTPAPGAAR